MNSQGKRYAEIRAFNLICQARKSNHSAIRARRSGDREGMFIALGEKQGAMQTARELRTLAKFFH